MFFSKNKFLSLSPAARHKKCFELIKKGLFQHYAVLCSWLELAPIDSSSLELVEERFHYHMKQAGIALREADFLIVSTKDKEEAKEWLGVWTYLDSLRSAHNVGSIVRTVEAFRLGPIRLSPSMLIAPDHPQVEKTSMGSLRHVDIQKTFSFEELPRPWVALETAPEAPSIFEFPLTAPCTLIVGNEERGVSQEIRHQSDVILQIPLRGRKNSLNVSCAFAIAASKVVSNCPFVYS